MTLLDFKNNVDLPLTANIASADTLYQCDSGMVELLPLPTLVVPDLHGRREMLWMTLNKQVRGKSVLDWFMAGDLNIVFTGDAVHGESRAKDRWGSITYEVMKGRLLNKYLREEIVESTNLIAMLAELKRMNPRNFYHLRGNHDDIDEQAYGPYGKYSRLLESSLFKSYLLKTNPTLFTAIRGYEDNLPLVAYNEDILCSHCAPANYPNINNIKRKTLSEFKNFAWSDNTWMLLQTAEMFKDDHCPGGQWLIGHRPVTRGPWENKMPLQRIQLGGGLVQVNHPGFYAFSLKFPGRPVKTYVVSRNTVGVDLCKKRT